MADISTAAKPASDDLESLPRVKRDYASITPGDSADSSAPPKRMKVNDNVARHYSERPNSSRLERESSPIIDLRSFNNWIKSVLINKYSQLAYRRENGASNENVLDICGGKGGDLQKWAKAHVKEWVLVGPFLEPFFFFCFQSSNLR